MPLKSHLLSDNRFRAAKVHIFYNIRNLCSPKQGII